MPNDLHQVHQPFWRYGEGNNDLPDRFEFQMWQPDILGWPVNPTFIPVLTGEPFFFDCGEGFLIKKCREELKRQLDVLEAPQVEVDHCVSDNFPRCATILTTDPPYLHGWIQVRSCYNHPTAEICSPWSSDVNKVPEPGLILALAIACIVLAGMSWWRKTHLTDD